MKTKIGADCDLFTVIDISDKVIYGANNPSFYGCYILYYKDTNLLGGVASWHDKFKSVEGIEEFLRSSPRGKVLKQDYDPELGLFYISID